MDFRAKSIQKISYILKFHRRMRMLSQLDMANLIRISLRNYQRIEAGEVEPKLETLGLISEVLSLPISSLLFSDKLEVYGLKEWASIKEYQSILGIVNNGEDKNSCFQFAHLLIEEDKKIVPSSQALSIEVEGERAYLSPALCEMSGTSKELVNIDDHLVEGSCVERWEMVFREKILNPVIQNTLSFSSGVFVFEEYHFNMSIKPDNPRTSCIVRDVTNRSSLEHYLNTQKAIFINKKNLLFGSRKNNPIVR